MAPGYMHDEMSIDLIGFISRLMRCWDDGSIDS